MVYIYIYIYIYCTIAIIIMLYAIAYYAGAAPGAAEEHSCHILLEHIWQLVFLYI